MSFELTEENALDLLIFSVIGADGSISYDEMKTTEKLLKEVGYTPLHFNLILEKISGMSTKHIEEKIKEAEQMAANMSSQDKARSLEILNGLETDDDHLSDEETERLNEIKAILS